MASTEQPPKKRRPYDPSQPAAAPPSTVSTSPQPLTIQTNSNAPTTTLSPEEIAQKRRNQEEIRDFYESYKQLKHCISHKDANMMSELEHAYLSLISASRGCTSVQRLVAEFVPKYASYCPTALEAAAKVCINIHNSSLEIIKKGEDSDKFLCETAIICIFGLATISQAASSETQTSSVIQGICSAVFLSVIDFFTSSLEAQEILQIVNKDVLKMYDCPKTFSELKQKFSDADETPAVKLSKCRALCIVWIFFRDPRNSLAACFELCKSNSTGANSNEGHNFLNQVTARLDTCYEQVLIDGSVPEDATYGSKNCLLGLVIDKESSLKQWIFSTVKSISKSSSPNVMSVITSAFEKVFASFTEQMKANDKQVDNNVDEFFHTHLSVSRTPCDLEHHGSVKSNIHSNTSCKMDLDSVDDRELSRASALTRLTSQTSLGVGSNSVNVENNASSGGMNHNLESPKHRFPSWHCDGDRAAMDIYSASRHLWVGSLGPEASEPLVRFQFERFGTIHKLLYIPFKGFAVIEYKNIMDAVKARELMRGQSLWGASLLIKFLDIGLGTRSVDINGVAVGSCCDVYVGNIHSLLDKDEILYEIRKVIYKGPLAVSDLMSEGALLMEFRTPEEATTVMAHLRQHRKEKRDFAMTPVDGSGPRHVDLRNNNLGNGMVGSPHAQNVVGFSHYGNHNTNTMELASPRVNMVNQGATMQSGYPFQAGSHVAPGSVEQNWNYRNPENVPHSAPVSMVHGHNYAPSQPIQASSYMRPVYYPPNSSWHHVPLNPVPSGVMPSNLHNNAVTPPFLPASVTPLAQIQGNSLPQHDQMFYVPPQPHMPPPPLPPHQNMAAPLPPHQNMPPPLPPHQNMPPPLAPHQNMPPPLAPHQNMPPPLPMHPELPPPLPPSPFLEAQPPPPPPPFESSMVGGGGYWQGTLSKSGVHYSTIHAHRLHSDACNYKDSISEPAEWPTKLDITKRTDFRHVMSTFSSTPQHKREVCQLLPTSAGDYKGFEDFISYLKQRECAGVIKIPATKTIWARLVFILPYSQETCSLLSVTPDTVDCLIALVLPKETNFEWV